MRRAIRALVRKTFGKNHSMRTEASIITMLVCVGFFVAVMAYFTSLMVYYAKRERPVRYAENLVVVNPPESWMGFTEEFQDSLSENVAGEKTMNGMRSMTSLLSPTGWRKKMPI